MTLSVTQNDFRAHIKNIWSRSMTMMKLYTLLDQIVVQ